MPQFHFWKHTVGRKSNEFCCRLACIAVNKANLIWGWREFRKDYRHIGLLCSYFPNVSIVDLFTIMTNNVLDYICAFLNLRLPVRFYKQFLDCPNIIYDVAKIKKPGYEKLNIFVLSIRGLSAIPKTMIFVNNINEKMALTEYLHTKLSHNLKDKAEQVIRCFHLNLSDKSRKLFAKDFFQENTRIEVCTKAAGLSINIPNWPRLA